MSTLEDYWITKGSLPLLIFISINVVYNASITIQQYEYYCHIIILPFFPLNPVKILPTHCQNNSIKGHRVIFLFLISLPFKLNFRWSTIKNQRYFAEWDTIDRCVFEIPPPPHDRASIHIPQSLSQRPTSHMHTNAFSVQMFASARWSMPWE